MDEKEFSQHFVIPANYTDSGRLFGGMLEARNAVEAVLLLLVIGYPELMWVHISLEYKVILMTLTLLPVGAAALMGIAGDSLFQYVSHMTRFWIRRRRLSFRRIGHAQTPYTRARQRKQKQRVRAGLHSNKARPKRDHRNEGRPIRQSH